MAQINSFVDEKIDVVEISEILTPDVAEHIIGNSVKKIYDLEVNKENLEKKIEKTYKNLQKEKSLNEELKSKL